MKLKIVIVIMIGLMLLPVFAEARSFARWHTSMGSFTAELYDEIVPITANNFISLSNSGFYNNLIFHRVVAGFVIQDGCPLGTGYGGPGYTIPDEFSPLLHHDQAGILAMAHSSAANSAGSQYYITLAPTPNLDGNYAVFGKIIQGLDNVLTIGTVPVGVNDRPITPVNIYQLRILDLHVVSVFPDPAEVIQCNTSDPLMFMIEASTQNAQVSYSWYIDELLQSGQSEFIYEPVIASGGNHTVRCNIASTDSIDYNVTWNIQASSANNDNNAPLLQPKLHCYPNPFKNHLELAFDLKEPAEVCFQIYNLKGQKVRSIALGNKTAGTWNSTWDTLDSKGNACPSGIYLIRMQAGNRYLLSKNILIR